MSNVYWVYLRPAGTAMVHVVGCAHAPDQNGTDISKTGAHRWKGPFEGHDQAWAHAKKVGAGDARQCPFCAGLAGPTPSSN